MKNSIKCFVLLTALLIGIGCPVNVYANYEALTDYETTEKIEPRAEKTEYIYTFINGVRHRRLWSITYGRWIDPEWTPWP